MKLEVCPYCGQCPTCCGEGWVYPKDENGKFDYTEEKVPCANAWHKSIYLAQKEYPSSKQDRLTHEQRKQRLYKPKNYSDFVCSCGDKKEKVRKMQEKVFEEIRADDSNVFSAVLMTILANLEDNYYGHVTNIASDQWHLISAELYYQSDDMKDDVPIANISVQCDYVEEGICRVYQLIKEAENDHLQEIKALEDLQKEA